MKGHKMQLWKQHFATKLVSAEEAVTHLKNGDRIYVGSMCSEPGTIIKAMGNTRLSDIVMLQFLTGREAASLAARAPSRFNLRTFFPARRIDQSELQSDADYVPLFHSQIPDFFRKRRIPIDVAIVPVSPPDRFGRFSLGISVDISLAAVESARTVIAQVNPLMPWTLGDTFISGDRINYLVEATEDLFEVPEEPLGDREKAISRYCGELIEDGSVLQFGFAGISRGLLDSLRDHRNLGLHTEVFSDPIVDLIESGVINNSTKKMFRGKSLATCCIGTRRAYDYIDNNSLVELYPSDICLNPRLIASNDNMIAINVALQVDLRGQIRQGNPTWTAVEGSGGDHDFMRGAGLSRKGRSIVCLRSTAEKSGRSTIVPTFSAKPAVVMMNRGDTNYVITTMALIEIAHPNHREALLKEARELRYVYPDQFYYRMASPELTSKVRVDTVFKNGLNARIRPIKPSDESMIQDLFYNLSESSVYFRYFAPRRSMPHENLQRYVNVSEDDGLSLVVVTGPRETERIIAESRYILGSDKEFADVAFMVDEKFHGLGIATFLLKHMIEIAKEKGIKGLKADVLDSNSPMLAVFNKLPYVQHRQVGAGEISLKFKFDEFK
jgi:acyl-CoA hydrolase/GNAT superfamily N-acetyltransferase